MPLGAKVTCVGEPVCTKFPDRLITIAMLRIRDFRGSRRALTARGN